MGKKCLKCGYERQASDLCPDYECPKCGVIYAKIESLLQQKTAPKIEETPSANAEVNEAYQFSFPVVSPLLSLLSLSFLLPKRLKLPAAPEDLRPATLAHRIWAAIATFLYMFFAGWIMRYIGIILGSLYLQLTDSYSTTNYVIMGVSMDYGNQTRNFIAACGGGGLLLGMLTAVLLLPLLWQGFSFGQRIMEIFPVSTSDEDIEYLSSLEILLRRLTFRTRSTCAAPMVRHPWNKALLPFAAILLVHFIVLVPTTKILNMAGLFSSSASNITSEQKQKRSAQRDAMLDAMATQTLKRQCANGNQDACDALQDMQQQRDPEYAAKVKNYRLWQQWAQWVRQYAKNIDNEYGASMTVDSWDGEKVEITHTNIEEIIEQERPEEP